MQPLVDVLEFAEESEVFDTFNPGIPEALPSRHDASGPMTKVSHDEVSLRGV